LIRVAVESNMLKMVIGLFQPKGRRENDR
jgi:hypothetical protein